MDSNVSANVGYIGSIPIPGRYQRTTKPMPNNCWSCALEPGILNYWSPHAWACLPKQETPQAWALQTQLHAVQPQVERAVLQQQRPSINKPKKLWKGNRILANLPKYIWSIFNVPKMPKYTWIGEGNGHPLQFSCLENPMDRGAWQATLHGVPKSLTWLSQLNNNLLT